MNIFRVVASAVGSTKSGYNFNHHVASDSEAGFFEIIKAAARARVERYKAQVQEQDGTEQVLQMSDSMLKDIGLAQSDRNSLKAGLTSLEELNARREAYYNRSK